jgi:hypothetical protein
MENNRTSNINTREIGPAGGPIVWDDIQVALSGAKIPAASPPTWRTHDFGIAAGIAFSVLGFAVGDQIDFYIQTSHSQKLNSVLEDHLHGTIPTDDSGKKIQWQLDVIAAGIGEDWAVVAGSPFTNEMTLTGAQAGKHNYFDIAEIPAVNTTVSSVYICRLTRIAASSDEYGSEVYLIYNDAHYMKDTIGSLNETSKV